jgi:hypothetical protein
MRRTVGGTIWAVIALTVVTAAGAYLVRGNAAYDPMFDTDVTNPVYPARGPVVLYDEGHRNAHTADGAYAPLAKLMRADGFTVRVSRGTLNATTLDGVRILVLALATGASDTNDDDAYPLEESRAIEKWVRDGGSLLLITDHWPYGSAVRLLAERFGVTMGAGMVQDLAHFDAVRGDSHLVFSEENGLLADHPIVRGRNATERVRKVLTFTGQSIAGPPGSVPFLRLSSAATERAPGTPRVDRQGGDVRVHMEYGAPTPAADRAQGLALEFGSGRVVVLGEAGLLRAQRPLRGNPVGMNVVGYDNRQLALNIMRWLSRAN